MKTYNAYSKRGILSFIAFASILIFYSQEVKEVDLVDLREKSDEKYGAAAKYIFSNCEIRFEGSGGSYKLIREIHQRIKIYNDNGFDYADIEIPLFESSNSNKERLSKVKCKTYNLEETNKVIISEFDKKEVLYEEEDTYRVAKLTMPNVKEGSIIELSYTISSPFIYLIPKWYFQEEIPVDYSSYKIFTNDHLSYSPIIRGIFPVELDVQKEGSSSSNFFYFAQDVPPLEEDEFVLNINDYKSSIKLELHSVNIPGLYHKDYTTDWKTICTNLMEDDDFGPNLKNSLKHYDGILAEAKQMSNIDKVNYIYEYVRDYHEWDGSASKYAKTGMKKLFLDRKGNSADLNMLLIGLLRKAGFEAYPVLTKNRNDGVLNVSIPSLTEVNYLFTLLHFEGKDILLDPSDSNCIFGMLPNRAINISGVLMDMNNVQAVDLINPNNYKYLRNSNWQFNNENSVLEGTGTDIYKLHAAKLYRDNLEQKDEEEENPDEIDEEIEDEFTALDSEGVEDKNLDIKVNFEGIIRKGFMEIDGKIFLPADLNMGLNENPFNSEKREFPVFYANKYDVRYISTISLPENITPEFIPEPIIYLMQDNLGSFMYDVKHFGNKMVISYAFKINSDIIQPEDYPDLKRMYETIVEKNTERIILKKK